MDRLFTRLKLPLTNGGIPLMTLEVLARSVYQSITQQCSYLLGKYLQVTSDIWQFALSTQALVLKDACPVVQTSSQ